MNKVIAIICFLIICSSIYAQNIIKGKYFISGGYTGTTLTIKDSSSYEYMSCGCLECVSDFGKYEVCDDTLIFHSLLKPEDTINREIDILVGYSEIKKDTVFDSIFVTLFNKTENKQSYPVNIMIGDSLFLHIDSLKVNDLKSYIFFAHKNSNNLNITFIVDTVKMMVSHTNTVDFEIRTKYTRIEKYPFTEVLIYENEKMYSLRVFQKHHKKFYYELQK